LGVLEQYQPTKLTFLVAIAYSAAEGRRINMHESSKLVDSLLLMHTYIVYSITGYYDANCVTRSQKGKL